MKKVSISVKRIYLFTALLLFTLLIFVVEPCMAGSFTLSWDTVDDPDVVGYNVYSGTTSGMYTTKIDVGDVTSFEVIDQLPEIEYFYSITAYGFTKEESPHSDELVVMIGQDGKIHYKLNTNIERKLTGWWYDPVETSGNGLSLEIQKGNRLFMGWYSYDDTGRPVWYTSGNLMEDQQYYSGELLMWTGWSLNGTPGKFQSYRVGTVQIMFLSMDRALLSWTLDNGYTGEKYIRKFMADIAPGEKDSRDIHGWWRDPRYDGTGFFIECQGGGLYMAWYHYRDDGSTRWWSSGGAFPSGSNHYSSLFSEWTNGAELDSFPAPPDANPADRGDVSIEFLSSGNAVLVWAGQQYNLERFLF